MCGRSGLVGAWLDLEKMCRYLMEVWFSPVMGVLWVSGCFGFVGLWERGMGMGMVRAPVGIGSYIAM